MDLVTGCRAHGFGIWPTLSEPIQVRIGILNQLTPEAITEIVSRFADAMLDMSAEFGWLATASLTQGIVSEFVGTRRSSVRVAPATRDVALATP